MPELIIFLVALIAAIRGADWVGKSSISFAKRLGVSSFVIGATFVSIATTLPELTIAFISGNVNQNPLFGLGNVIGSPIINLGLILGLFFILTKERPTLGYYSRAINIFIAISSLLFILTLFRPIGGIVSLLLIISGTLFLLLEFLLGQKSHTFLDTVENRFEKFISFFHLTGSKDVVFEFVFGTALLLFGAKFMIDSGIAIANLLSVDSFYISATVLAIGTSLPELVTMFNSIAKKRFSLSMGNLVGASVLNITLGIGLSTLTVNAAIKYPFNFLFFIPLILCGVFGLLALWPKFRLNLIGLALLTIASVFVFALTFIEFIPQ